MLLKEHKKYYNEIFKIPGVLAEPFLMIGVQDIGRGYLEGDGDNIRLKAPANFKPTFEELLNSKGVENITILDGYDPRAGLFLDLNEPITKHFNRIPNYNTVFDIGCIEHVWNPAQCLLNYHNFLSVDGLLVIHTPICGYYDHGYHIFNPAFFLDFFKNNFYEVIYCKFSTISGAEIPKDSNLRRSPKDVIFWVVAKKTTNLPVKYPIQSKFLLNVGP